MSASAEIVVLASGRGSNLAALLAAQRDGRLAARIVAVLSDRASAPALAIAREAGVAAHAFDPRSHPQRRDFDLALFDAVDRIQPQLIVCAGYLRIIAADVVARYPGRMLNIHPSLLPAYPGLKTHERVLAAGDRVHGASVHFVTAELDGGPVIAQVRMPVRADDHVESLAQRLLPLEHRLLVATVHAVARGEATMQDAAVAWRGERLRAPLQLGDDDRLHVEAPGHAI